MFKINTLAQKWKADWKWIWRICTMDIIENCLDYYYYNKGRSNFSSMGSYVLSYYLTNNSDLMAWCYFSVDWINDLPFPNSFLDFEIGILIILVIPAWNLNGTCFLLKWSPVSVLFIASPLTVIFYIVCYNSFLITRRTFFPRSLLFILRTVSIFILLILCSRPTMSSYSLKDPGQTAHSDFQRSLWFTCGTLCETTLSS